MATALRTLTLAACLPLLLPAGYCLCDAGADPHADATDHDADHPGDCHCPDGPAVTPAAKPVQPDAPTAAPGWSPAVARLTAAVVDAPPPVRPLKHPPSAPLYVSHCALVR